MQFTPVRLPGISSAPKYRDREVAGVSLQITDHRKLLPVQTGVAVLRSLQDALPEQARTTFFRAGFDDIAGSAGLRQALVTGLSAQQVELLWTPGVEAFLERRRPYLLY